MIVKKTKELPPDVEMRCYVCEDSRASHVCRFQIDEMMVQVCLCGECMKMDTECLLKNTIGIEEPSNASPQDFLIL